MPVQQRITRRAALASRVGSSTRKAYAAQVHREMRQPAGPRVTISRAKVLHSPIGSAIRKAYAKQVHKVTGAPSLAQMSNKMNQLRKSHGKSHPKTRSYARKYNKYHLISASGGSSSRSEAARKAWRTRRGH